MLTDENLILSMDDARDKNDVFRVIIENLQAQGYNVDYDAVMNGLLDREAQISTGFEQGIAIPHAKVGGITEPIVTVVQTNDLDWPSMDGKPTDFIINILVPLTGGEDHLRILAHLTRRLIDPQFIVDLKNADKKEIADIINSIDNSEQEEEEHDVERNEHHIAKDTRGGRKSFVAVTSCAMGVAHTYMAAESLEKFGKENGWDYKVETQGTVGAENPLTDEDIANADVVVLAIDRQIEKERFIGKEVIEVGTKEAIHDPESVLEKPSHVLNGSKRSTNSDTKGQNEVMKALLNGVSYMLPLVVIGGLFLGLAFAFGGVATPEGMVVQEGTIWYTILKIGETGFTLMIPILAGYIAYAIGDRPALAPGLIIGWIANNPSFYNGEAPAGFLGAIIGGLLVGYFVKYFARIRVHKNLQAIMPILIIPIVTTLVTSGIFIYVIGAPVAWAFTAMSDWLASLPREQFILIGALLGFMIAVDMGGPINKTAMLFAIGMIGQGQPEFMGMNGIAVATPTIGLGIATLVGRRYFTEDDQAAGIAALVMGMAGITEGAIPFAASYPKQIFPANIIGAMVGGAAGAAFGVANSIPHGGPIIALAGWGGAVNHPVYMLLAILIGAAVTAFIAIALMRLRDRTNAPRL